MDDYFHGRVVVKGLILLGLVIFWIYRWINRETTKVQQALHRLENPYSHLPPPVDPAIYWYLESRRFDAHAVDDFSKVDTYAIVSNSNPDSNSAYPYVFLKDSMEFAFKFEYGLSYGFTEEGNEYRIITLAPSYRVKYASSKTGVVVNQSFLMIYPHFYQIQYHPALKLLCCITYLNKTDYLHNTSDAVWDRYYFDLKGRYIGNDQGTNGQPPTISLN